VLLAVINQKCIAGDVMIRFPGLLMVILFSLNGYCRIHAGESVPDEACFSFLKEDQKHVLIVVDSERTKTVELLKGIGEHLKEMDAAFVLVDSHKNLGSDVAGWIQEQGLEWVVLDDPARKIAQGLGVIVRPTILFVNENKVVHSVIVDFRTNTIAQFRHNMRAFLEGRPAEDFVEAAKERKQKAQLHSQLKRALTLFKDEQYELAAKLFQSALLIEPENRDALLGLGYCQLLSLGAEPCLRFINTHAGLVEHPRGVFLRLLCRGMLSGSDEDLMACFEQYRYETIFLEGRTRLSELLNENGHCAMAVQVLLNNQKRLRKELRQSK